MIGGVGSTTTPPFFYQLKVFMRVHNKSQSQVTIKAFKIRPITIAPNSTYEFESMEQLKEYKAIISKIAELEIDLSPKKEIKVETPQVKEEEIALPLKRGRRPNLENLKAEPLIQE